LVDGNDAHILVALIHCQGHTLRAINIAQTIDFVVLVRHVHQVLVDDGLGRLGAFPAQAFIGLQAARGGGTADQHEEHFAPPAIPGNVVEEIDEALTLFRPLTELGRPGGEEQGDLAGALFI
jgi:hypothetical protein